MLTRAITIAAALLFVTAAAGAAQSELLDLDLLWRRGQFEMARELINAHLAAGHVDTSFLAQAAPCAEGMHDYQLAADLWAWLAESAGNADTYRMAREHEWRNRWELEADGDAPWIAAAREDIAARLEETKLRASRERQLALELEFILARVVANQERPGRELREDYPDSEPVLRAAKDSVDALGVERDNETRLAMIDSFLTDYPDSYWRHYAWRYKLYAAWQLHNRGLLIETADAYLAEYPSHPESYGAISRYYLEADVDLQTGYEYALRSVELYETAMGLDGSAASLERLQLSTQDEAPQPDYLPAGQRARFTEYMGSRYNLARYHVIRGEYAEALEMVEPLIALDPFTANEEHTLAPFTLIAAQVYEAQEDYFAAYEYYLLTAAAGDSRNRYALQAEQQLPKLEDKLRDSEIETVRGRMVPQGLAGVSLPRFTDVTLELGLDKAAGRRVAWGDVDLDGDADLLVDGRTLWRNDAGTTATGGRFNDISRMWTLANSGVSGVFADIDNDGDLDIYSAAHGRNGDKLWRNEYINRSGTPAQRFVEITAVASNPSDDYPSEGAAWLDFDNDGFVDLYVANYELPRSETSEYGVGTPDRLYHNEGGTRLALVDMAAVGIVPNWGGDRASRGGVAVADYDGDGDQDLFVGNYRLQENYLWQNNGDGTFRNSARLAGVAGYSVEGWWGHTIGAAWGDVDNDGDLDLFSANLAHPRYAYISDKSQLLINEHEVLGVMFHDERTKWGVHYEETHAGPVFFDANNDGWLDLYITSIYPGRRSFLYLNDGRGGFHDVTWLSGTRVLDGWGAAWADYDNDGDLDLAVGSGEGVRLLRNDSPPQPWLQVRLTGGMGRVEAQRGDDAPFSNAAAIGARVTLSIEGKKLVREIQSGTCTGCGNELLAHFGLGARGGMIHVSVRFPSGRTATRMLKEPNQVIEISEVDARPVEEEPDAGLVPNRGVDAASSEDGAEDEVESLDDLARPTDTRGA